MTFEEAAAEIESHAFAARLNVASDFGTFLQGIHQQEAPRTLLRELGRPQKRQQLFVRILELSREPVDPRYESQWDTALAVYVWLMNARDPDLGRLVAQAAARVPQCWWSRRVSRHILLGEAMRNNANTESREVTPLHSVLANADEIVDSGEVFFPINFIPLGAVVTVLQPDMSTDSSLGGVHSTSPRSLSGTLPDQVLSRSTDSSPGLEEVQIL